MHCKLHYVMHVNSLIDMQLLLYIMRLVHLIVGIFNIFFSDIVIILGEWTLEYKPLTLENKGLLLTILMVFFSILWLFWTNSYWIIAINFSEQRFITNHTLSCDVDISYSLWCLPCYNTYSTTSSISTLSFIVYTAWWDNSQNILLENR